MSEYILLGNSNDGTDDFVYKLQSTQPMSSGDVTTVMTDCCANCVETPAPAMGEQFTV